MKLPQLIRVERMGDRHFRFEIDGEPFPYAIPGDTHIEVNLVTGDCPTIRFTLLAERVEVLNALEEPKHGDA